jgi:hypothetical protein
MMIARPMNNPEFRNGDKVVLAEGTYQGTPGVFLKLRDEVNWAAMDRLRRRRNRSTLTPMLRQSPN